MGLATADFTHCMATRALLIQQGAIFVARDMLFF